MAVPPVPPGEFLAEVKEKFCKEFRPAGLELGAAAVNEVEGAAARGSSGEVEVEAFAVPGAVELLLKPLESLVYAELKITGDGLPFILGVICESKRGGGNAGVGVGAAAWCEGKTAT